ncbi:hypothetical protein G6011_00818 [Alternaria panax]|uniref:Rhodopsin domain-containing protein n=1 Tax=Alternaria panax TaxID=48097 RepID=A0AAD4NV24_9PLEO|nr:hypothetical protein G6011_00818 [Alternaria panax]
MDVDASAVSPSGAPLPWLVPDRGPLHLAIVVTLALTALLIYSLRAFTRGRLLRSFAIDDGLMALAALCTIGIFITFTGVIELGIGQQEDGYVLPVSKTVQMGPWMWALNSLIIVGLGVVKLSVTFTLLPLANARNHSYLLMVRAVLLVGLMLLVFWHTVEWFISLLAQCVPLVAAWDLSNDKALCMSQIESKHWALANYPLNAASSLLLIFFTIPITISSSLKLGSTLHLLAVVSLGLFACAAAIIRTWMVVTSWTEVGYRNNFDLNFTTWGICEFLTATIAVNLSTLLPLGRVIRSPDSAARVAPRSVGISGPVAGSTVHLLHGDVDEVVPSYSESYTHTRNHSYNSRYSGHTVIYRPDTAYFPSHFQHSNHSTSRFHDDESNLDFDIEAPSTQVSPPHKTTKLGPSSRFSVSTVSTRRVSDWSQLSEFSHKDSEVNLKKEKGGRVRVSAVELEEIVKSLRLKRHSSHETWDKELGSFEDKSEDGGSSVAPTIYLEDDDIDVDGTGDTCTCPAPRARDDASMQIEADSSEITVIRIRGSAKCSLHRQEPGARPTHSRLNSGEWIARAS